MPTPGSFQATAQLEGVLDRVAFASEETGFSVVKLIVAGKVEPVTAVGNLLGLQPGESLRLQGQWVKDKAFGEQFKVEHFESVRPATAVGIEKYLGSGLVPGVGKAMASRIVAKFGDATLDVIEKHPERLREVEGIGKVRLQRIQQAWAEQQHIREVMVFLQSHGVSTLLAVRIYKHFGDQAVKVVREDPYRLAMEVYGIGFKTADTIARNLGIAKTSPQRAQAGVMHMIGNLSDDGHTYVPRSLLRTKSAEMLEIDDLAVDSAIDGLVGLQHLIAEKLDVENPGGEEAIYGAALFTSEHGSAALLHDLIAAPARPISVDVPKAIAWFEAKQKLALAPEQREAIAQAIQSKVMVITGGPGTGKTTLVNGIIQILEKKNLQIILTAPTGRAAKRMSETTGHPASTLHRLLEYSPAAHGFGRDRYRPLEADLVILDEASMVDIVLLFGVLKALPPRCRLVLVGDVDQLPSVGPGAVLKDLIASESVPVVRLQHVFRQAQQSLIVVNAHRIQQGQLPKTAPPGEQHTGDFFIVERQSPDDVLQAIRELVKERIPKRFGLDPVEAIQVLTPMNRGPLGTTALNLMLQTLLNPVGPAVIRGAKTLRLGDKVMQLRNNYDLEVFNGDVGRVVEVKSEDHQLRVDMDGRVVTYDYAQLDELQVAYAATIHKSQGSEYPAVVIPLHTSHHMMLARNLLYTAVTRGKRLVVLVGPQRALQAAVDNARAHDRYTRLCERMQVDPRTW
jgi:exodeoxyribonuclease V alpha subunit